MSCSSLSRVVSWALTSASLAALTLSGCTDPGGDETGETTGTEPGPRLEGVADLHLHMFAEDAFGGGWFHGNAVGMPEVALAPCDGGEPGDHAWLREEIEPLLGQCTDLTVEELAVQVPIVGQLILGGGGLVTEFIATIPGTTGDTGEHADRTTGWPELEGWPKWDSIAHQQSWEGHVKQAYDDGLRVEVVSAVSFNWLCLALRDENVVRPVCDEMADVKVQLEAANAFAAANDWVEIALSAEDARRIVEEDKLAIILSIEASHIFDDGDWRAQLDEVYALGVRTLQPVHQLDNRFGGAAPHNSIFQIAMYAENCHIDEDCGLTSPDVTLGFDVDADCRNVKGLTSEGEALINEMISRGMLIDIAHMSEQSVRDTVALTEAADYYPLYFSHAHFREIMTPEKGEEEKTTPSWIVAHVRESGGMVGLRTAHEETNSYDGSPVTNTCHGSSRSFAQAYDYGRLGLKVAMGLGSDLNGFIQQTRPRFGPDACSASFEEEATCQAKDERQSGVPRLGTEFDEIGLGHMGTLGDLLDDLDALGTDTEPLRTSAHDFVVMWERAQGERSGPFESVDDLDAGGVTVLDPHWKRLNAFPRECEIAYCPGGLVSGESCRFDAECESGTCAGAGECGNPRGNCE